MEYGYDRDDLGYESGYERVSPSEEQKKSQWRMGDPEAFVVVYQCQTPPTPNPTLKIPPNPILAHPTPQLPDGGTAVSGVAYNKDGYKITVQDGKWVQTADAYVKAGDGNTYGKWTKKDGTVEYWKGSAPNQQTKINESDLPGGKWPPNKDPVAPPPGPVNVKPVPGAPNPKATTGIAGAGMPLAEQSFRGKLKDAGLSDQDADLYMKTKFPADMNKREAKIKQAEVDLNKRLLAAKDNSELKTRLTDDLNGEVTKKNLSNSWDGMMKKGVDPDKAKKYLEAQGFEFENGSGDKKNPPKLSGPLTPYGRKHLSEVSTQVNSAEFRGDKIDNYTSQLNDVKDYLSRFKPGPEQEFARNVLKSQGYIDDKDKPKGDWKHEDFAKTLYEVPPKDDKTPGDIPADLKDTKIKQLNGGNDLSKGPLGEMQAALNKNPPDFKAARAALDKADPTTQAVGNQYLSKAYADGVHGILTAPPEKGGYGFSPDDATAVEVARGLKNPDGSTKSVLKAQEAEDQLRTSGGFDTAGQPSGPRTKNQIKIDTAKFYRDNLSGEMVRMGMKGDDAAKRMAFKGFLEEPENMPSGALGQMQKDYKDAVNTRGKNDEAKKLALDWKTEAKNTIMPTGLAVDRYGEVRGNVDNAYQPDGPRKPPNQELEQARQRLYGAEQQKKSLDPKQRELDLKEQELQIQKDNASQQRNLERDKMKQEKEIAQSRLDFDKESADENRKLQREQMKMQMMTTVIQFLGSLITTAMQMLSSLAFIFQVNIGAGCVAQSLRPPSRLSWPDYIRRRRTSCSPFSILVNSKRLLFDFSVHPFHSNPKILALNFLIYFRILYIN
jgi:hypothetical protein